MASLPATIATLWERFREPTMDRVGILEQAAKALLTGELDELLRQQAVRVAHKLAGSLGTFGFPHGSTLAREIEQTLEANRALGHEQAVHLSNLVTALRIALS